MCLAIDSYHGIERSGVISPFKIDQISRHTCLLLINVDLLLVNSKRAARQGDRRSSSSFKSACPVSFSFTRALRRTEI